MIKNSHILEQFNKAELWKEKTDYFHLLKIFEEMWREGIEVDIIIARILDHHA